MHSPARPADVGDPARTASLTPANYPWQVDLCPVDKLWQPDKTPRRYTRKEIKQAQDIIRRFGIRVPLLVDADGCVLAHFVVVQAARELDLDELPVIRIEQLSDAERNALSLAQTKLYEFGSFDQELLGECLIEIEAATPDIDFGDLGFEPAEVDRAIGAARRVGSDEPEPVINPSGPPVTKPGDIWLCGPHRIGCGDAASDAWLTILMAGLLAAMIFTDPPYGCRVAGFVTSRAHREFAQGAGRESHDEFAALLLAWCAAMRAVCRPGALAYLCIDWRSLEQLLAAARVTLGTLVNLIVWDKDRAGMGSFYRSQHELILLLRVPGAEHRNNVQLGRHGRNRSNVWRYPSAASFARSSTEGDLLADHPTPKNKEMIADAMLDGTARGEVVLDPFLGSGSTLIAAEKVGRRCYGSDLDPLYVDLAVRRWQAWTGQSAVHAETGERFDAVATAVADQEVAA